MVSLSLGLGMRPQLAAEFEAPTPPITSIAADGWRSTYPSPPFEMDPVGAAEAVNVSRAGFDASGQPTSVADTLTLMKRVREPYPNQATLTADQVALSDYVYAGDTISGVTNNSTRAAPKPIAMWLHHDCEHVTSSTHTVRLTVAHMHARSGRPVAAVKFVASDGTNTVETTVSTLFTITYAASGLTVPHYAAALDLSGLDQGAMITVDAVIYPWVGAAFTISTDAAIYPSINLTTLSFLNDRTGAYGTVYAYVDGVGAGSPAVHETAATAATTPFASVADAASAIQTYNNATFSRDNVSGGVIRLTATTINISATNARAVGDIPLVIEAADVANKATTIYSDGGASSSNDICDKLLIRNVTLEKTGNFIFLDSSGNASNMLVLDNCTFDAGGTGEYNAWVYRPGRLWLINCDGDKTGVANKFGTSHKTTIALGCSNCGAVSNTTYNMAGCREIDTAVSNIAAFGSAPASEGQFIGFNYLGSDSSSGAVARFEEPVTDHGLALVGNIFEYHGTSNQQTLYMLADGSDNTAENVVVTGNTFVGSRINFLYNDGTVSTEKSGAVRFNIIERYNTKGDVFENDGTFVGNWPVIFKVGYYGNTYVIGASQSGSYGPGQWLGEVGALGDIEGSAGDIVVDYADDQSQTGGGAGNGDYEPGASYAGSVIPAGLAAYSHDLYGTAIPNDGSAVAGAVQKTA